MRAILMVARFELVSAANSRLQNHRACRSPQAQSNVVILVSSPFSVPSSLSYQARFQEILTASLHELWRAQTNREAQLLSGGSRVPEDGEHHLRNRDLSVFTSKCGNIKQLPNLKLSREFYFRIFSATCWKTIIMEGFQARDVGGQWSEENSTAVLRSF